MRNGPSTPSRIIQAYYPHNRVPAAMCAQAFFRPSSGHPPHAAKVAQQKSAPKPPHPAKAMGASTQPPHAAQSKRATPLQRQLGDAVPGSSQVHAFAPPSGFLERNGGRQGQPLPPPVLRKMESFFQSDFSDVRIHVGPEATSIGAIAFTLGTDIHFAPGFYDPHSTRGQELLGHELTHVVQQRDGRVSNPLGDGIAVVQDFELEAEADRMGRAVAHGVPLQRAISAPSFGPPARDVTPIQRRVAQAKGAPNGAHGYRLYLGTYMHEDRSLPEPLSGHSFVALEEPTGERHAYGFSPANYGTYDPQKDLGRLSQGVPGVVHDDANAFQKRGVRIKEYTIDADQAQAAMAKVAEYQSGRYSFSLKERQCSAFALDVLGAAHVQAPVDGSVRSPRDVYEKLR